jgi:hypothetical protein
MRIRIHNNDLSINKRKKVCKEKFQSLIDKSYRKDKILYYNLTRPALVPALTVSLNNL